MSSHLVRVSNAESVDSGFTCKIFLASPSHCAPCAMRRVTYDPGANAMNNTTQKPANDIKPASDVTPEPVEIIGYTLPQSGHQELRVLRDMLLNMPHVKGSQTVETENGPMLEFSRAQLVKFFDRLAFHIRIVMATTKPRIKEVKPPPRLH
jgi:hypothetical protein